MLPSQDASRVLQAGDVLDRSACGECFTLSSVGLLWGIEFGQVQDYTRSIAVIDCRIYVIPSRNTDQRRPASVPHR